MQHNLEPGDDINFIRNGMIRTAKVEAVVKELVTVTDLGGVQYTMPIHSVAKRK